MSGRAWDSDALVQTLATYMAAPGGIVAITPAHRALAAWLWACVASMGRRLLHRDERLLVQRIRQAAGTRQINQAASAAEGVFSGSGDRAALMPAKTASSRRSRMSLRTALRPSGVLA